MRSPASSSWCANANRERKSIETPNQEQIDMQRTLRVCVLVALVATAATRIRAPGYSFQESDSVGEVKVDTVPGDGQTLRLSQHGLAVLVYRKGIQ
jgi:hypothetical protein